MIPTREETALATLSFATLSLAMDRDATLHERLLRSWRGEPGTLASASEDIREAAEAFDRVLPALTRSPGALERLGPLIVDPHARVLFAWCDAVVGRVDVTLAPLLAQARKNAPTRELSIALARRRVVQGPLLDALDSAPIVGSGGQYRRPENEQARARIEILLWDAGAGATHAPELGAWIFGSDETFDEFVAIPASGSLRGRVLAARCLEVAAKGMPTAVDSRLLGRALQVLQPLILHPEPLVYIHAARALGLIAGQVEHLEGMLLDWMGSKSLVLRQRALTAFACLPAVRLSALKHEFLSVFERPGADRWAPTAAAAGTPYLVQENRELWDHLAERILIGQGGAEAARELARGLATVWRGSHHRHQVEQPLLKLRQLARRAKAVTIEQWRDWLMVLSSTDIVEAAERDPLDLETGLENLVHQAAMYDDEESDARAARFADALKRTFEAAMRITLEDQSPRHRAAGMNALEGVARSMALRLWGPQLATYPRGARLAEPDVTETWHLIATSPTALINVIKERRHARRVAAAAGRHSVGMLREREDVELEVLALRLGGYALDACGSDAELVPGRGPTAHQTCRWLGTLEGLAEGSRDLPENLQAALASMFWRLVDTTRGTALGAVDDVEWLGPFVAWWSLVIDRPTMLQQLGVALPMIREGVLEKCCSVSAKIRSLVISERPVREWGPSVVELLGELKASGTELEVSLNHLARVLDRFAAASGRNSDIEQRCLELVLAADRLQAALADPVKALHAASSGSDGPLENPSVDNAPRTAALAARAIRTRELSVLDVWLTSLGPVTSGLAERALQGAVSRTPPPPPSHRKLEPEMIEGYQLVRPLGEGGVGKVWLVRKPGADRLFVLKIPKREALTNASEVERKGLLESFIKEADALAGLYHPNVANIIDRGVAGDVPYLVLELLIGADLSQYSKAKLCSLSELRQVVLDSCAGLAALHGAQLVHRDIKPANIWLRLPLAQGECFESTRHRDPRVVRPLSTVVIDFGMVRPTLVSAENSGRFVAGTPGYIAPDQVLDPVELDGRADVYALAATIYNVTTGRAFFDEVQNPRDRIFAHMQRLPLEDPALLDGYPAGLVRLMRAATALDPSDRPYPMEFGRAFEAAL